MLDIGWSELLVVGVVALVVLKPEDIPQAIRTVGASIGKVKRMARDVQGQLMQALDEDKSSSMPRPFSPPEPTVATHPETVSGPPEKPKSLDL
jgi:sec-independent protein translocase protein TatB